MYLPAQSLASMSTLSWQPEPVGASARSQQRVTPTLGYPSRFKIRCSIAAYSTARPSPVSDAVPLRMYVAMA